MCIYEIVLDKQTYLSFVYRLRQRSINPEALPRPAIMVIVVIPSFHRRNLINSSSVLENGGN
jgi:hypothetical protein